MYWLLLLLFLLPSPVKAASARATSTPTPTEVPSPTPTLTNADEIQKIREVVQAKVKEKLKAIINPTSKKAYIGKITLKDSSLITIEFQGTTKTFTLTEEVAFVDQNRNKTKLDKLNQGQDILVMGIENNTDGTFEVKRVVVIDLSKVSLKKTVAIGKIVDVSRSSPIFTLIPTKNKNTLFQIKTDSKTEIVTTNKQKLKLSDIKSGHKVITVLQPDEKISKTYTALSVMDFDYSSAKPTGSPSPTPTPKR